MPIESDEGLNVIGFLCEGEPYWIKRSNLIDSLNGKVRQVGNKLRSLNISASIVKGNDDYWISITLDSIDLDSGKEFTLKTNQIAFSKTFPSSVLGKIGVLYYPLNDSSAFVKIRKFDATHQIISGSFGMGLMSAYREDTLYINKGRFDIKFLVH